MTRLCVPLGQVSEDSEYPLTHYLTRSSRECVPLPEHVQKGCVVGSNTVPSVSSETKIRGASFPGEERGSPRCEVEVK